MNEFMKQYEKVEISTEKYEEIVEKAYGNICKKIGKLPEEIWNSCSWGTVNKYMKKYEKVHEKIYNLQYVLFILFRIVDMKLWFESESVRKFFIFGQKI